MADAPQPRRPIVSRRTMLVGGGALAVVGVGGALAYKNRPMAIRVRQILISEFGYRMVKGKDAERFIVDITRLITHPNYGKRVKGAFFELPIREPRIAYFPGRRVRDTTVTLFLLRTNAYRVYAGKDRALIYTELDPYDTGCSNFISAPYRIA